MRLIHQRLRWATTFVALLGLYSQFAANAAAEDSGSRVIRVEEDWELVVREADTDNVAPQVTCTISPVGHANGQHAVFDLNLRNVPYFEAGGMQLQLWNGEEVWASKKAYAGVLLHHSNETVSWTTSMRLHDSYLIFSIKDGSSESWGSFGSDSLIRVVAATDLNDLNEYSQATTIANSGIDYSANRVERLVLKAVRAYLESGEVYEVDTPVVLYQHD